MLVRMNSTIVQNVVTYDTIIDFDNLELKLFPGMTAYVTIPVATANAIKVPNGALRYKPDLAPEEVRALYQQYGIPEAAGSPAQKSGAPEASHKTSVPGAPGTRTTSPVAGGEGQGPRYETQVVWKQRADKSLEPVRIKTGITDHTFTELVQQLNGELKPGDELVTGVAQGRASTGAPRMGGPGATRGK